MRINRNFTLIWCSFLISQIGDWMLKIALPLLVYAKTQSAAQMASIYGVSFLPWLFFSLVGGLLADRGNKQTILVVGNLVSFVAVFIMLVAFEIPATPLWLIYVLVFMQSSIDPLTHPSFQSILPEVVHDDKIVTANTDIQLIDNTLTLIGPLLGGALAALLNPRVAIIVDAISFLIAGIFVIALRYKVPTHIQATQNILQDIREGFAYAYSDKIVWNGAVLFFFTNFATNLFEANFMFFITKTLGYSSFLAGITIAISGIGALAGGIVAPIINRHYSTGRIITSTTVLAGIALMLMFFAHNFIVVGLLYAVANLFSNINVITYFSLRQKIVPDRILGRVVSVTRMISYVSIPLGAFFGGILVDKGVSLFVVFLLAGIIRFVIGAYGSSTPLGKSGSSATEKTK